MIYKHRRREDIPRGALHVEIGEVIAFGEGHSKSKVDGLNACVLCAAHQHEVAGLDVSVQDVVRVALRNSLQNSAHL